MTLKKKYRNICIGKIPTKFLFVTFTALSVYVCINLVSSNSVFSVKVDMFIKMNSLREKMVNVSDNVSTADMNKTDTLEHFPTYENERERGEQRVYPDVNETGFKNGVFDIYSDRNNKLDNSIDIRKSGNNVPGNRYNGTEGKYKGQYSDSTGKGDPLTETTQRGVNVSKNTISFQESFSPSFDVNATDSWASESENKNTSPHIDIFGNIADGSDKTRKLECSNCFKHNFNYVIENDICKSYDADEEIELLILITTTHKKIKARAALRSTWLSFTNKNTANIRYAFLLGETNDKRYKEDILREDDIYHDIIKEDFNDNYLNLTYKTIMGFKWAATKCAHAQFVMKTDDDMFVNIPNALKITRSVFGDILQTTVVGACSLHAKPIRNEKSKWFASVQSYPQSTYPGFCSGTGYITSMNVVRNIYQISPNVPFFHLEDVYVAMCLRKLNFKVQRVFGFNSGRPKLDPCIYKGNRLITAHQMTPIMLQVMWKRQCLRYKFY